jgi:hypothetical protein
MLGRIFGRKGLSFNQAAKQMAPMPDADGKTRIFSKEVFEGETGAVLKSFGFDPDDARNIVPTAEDYEKKFERAKQALVARVDKENAALQRKYGFGNVAPYFVYEDAVWGSKYNAYLVKHLELTTFDEWNVMLMGCDEQTRRVTGLGIGFPHAKQTDAACLDLVAKSAALYQKSLDAQSRYWTGGRALKAPDGIDELEKLKAGWDADRATAKQMIFDHAAYIKKILMDVALKV